MNEQGENLRDRATPHTRVIGPSHSVCQPGQRTCFTATRGFLHLKNKSKNKSNNKIKKNRSKVNDRPDSVLSTWEVRRSARILSCTQSCHTHLANANANVNANANANAIAKVKQGKEKQRKAKKNKAKHAKVHTWEVRRSSRILGCTQGCHTHLANVNVNVNANVIAKVKVKQGKEKQRKTKQNTQKYTLGRFADRLAYLGW